MMRLVANIISIIFHPLWMITYGVTFALLFTYLKIYPPVAKALIIGGTFFFTSFLPSVFIGWMVYRGDAKDLELTDRKERLVPYLILIASVISSGIFLHRMMMPSWVLLNVGAIVFALCICIIINTRWKISAHLLGIGGLMGALMGVSKLMMFNPYGLFAAGFISAGLLGWSRIYLGRHTPMQVYAGFSLGFVITLLASLSSFLLIVF
jgi:membrane-associated phospholipid phosphatase